MIKQRLFGKFAGGCLCRPDPLLEVKISAPLMEAEGRMFYDFRNKQFQVICKDCGRTSDLYNTRLDAIRGFQEARDELSKNTSALSD